VSPSSEQKAPYSPPPPPPPLFQWPLVVGTLAGMNGLTALMAYRRGMTAPAGLLGTIGAMEGVAAWSETSWVRQRLAMGVMVLDMGYLVVCGVLRRGDPRLRQAMGLLGAGAEVFVLGTMVSIERQRENLSAHK